MLYIWGLRVSQCHAAHVTTARGEARQPGARDCCVTSGTTPDKRHLGSTWYSDQSRTSSSARGIATRRRRYRDSSASQRPDSPPSVPQCIHPALGWAVESATGSGVWQLRPSQGPYEEATAASRWGSPAPPSRQSQRAPRAALQ
jgi:hypothetical protein